jgi:hypothetical protein
MSVHGGDLQPADELIARKRNLLVMNSQHYLKVLVYIKVVEVTGQRTTNLFLTPFKMVKIPIQITFNLFKF